MALTAGTRLGPYEVVAQIGVEGPTLADRIAQGAIPIDEALPIAKQVAEALEAARTGHNNDEGGRR